MIAVVSLLVALAVFRSCESDQTLVEFVRDYYAGYNIRQITVFACWNQSDAISIWRGIMNVDTAVTYYPITSDVDLKKVFRLNYHRTGLVLDFDCAFSDKLLEKFSKQLAFSESYYWTIVTKSSTIPSEFLQHLALTIESEVTVVTRDTNELFTLYDVYKINYRRGDAVKTVYKGQWTPVDGLKNELSQYKYKRRSDFQGLSLNFSIVLVNPPLPDIYTYLSEVKNTHLDNMSRANYNFILYLRDMYNFSINILHTNSWGYRVNGTLTGLIADVLKGKIDMSVSPFIFDKKRLDILDYTVETWIGDGSFIFRHPASSNLRNNFLMPFTNDLWFVTLIVAIAYWLLLLISLKVEWQYAPDLLQSNLTTMPASETGLTTVAALSQQGVNNGPTIFSGRIVFLSLFIWSLLLYQFYSASIVSCLLKPPPRWIRTISDLSDSDLEVGCQNITFFANYFQTSNDPANIELNARKLLPTKDRPQGGYYSIPEGVKRVKSGGFAFIMDRASIYAIIKNTFTEDDICELEEIRPFKPQKLSPILPKNSPYKKLIIYGLRRIVQAGLITRIRKIWRPPRTQCPETHKSKPTPMGMKQFSPALFLLLIGVAISIVVLMMECLHHCIDKEIYSARTNLDSTKEEDNQSVDHFKYIQQVLSMD